MNVFNIGSLPLISSSFVKIILIILGAYLVRRFAGLFITKVIRKMVVSDNFTSPESEKKREDTLIHVFIATLRVLIWLMAVLMILSELGINIGPLIAAAGIAGVALGFGGQYLIRDVIAGLFIILENQYRVGDVVCIGDTCGTVESVNLRMTILRDLDGTVHHIPNGEIKVASNKSKEFARVNLNVGVAYDTNLEKVIEVVNAVGKSLAEDKEWKDSITKAPEFLRVNDFEDSAVSLKILGEVKPLKQWAVTGELRKRLKIAFDKEGIEIPFPQTVIHTKK